MSHSTLCKLGVLEGGAGGSSQPIVEMKKCMTAVETRGPTSQTCLGVCSSQIRAPPHLSLSLSLSLSHTHTHTQHTHTQSHTHTHAPERESLLPSPQRADVLRQGLGQHINTLLHKVGGGGACGSLRVHRRVRTQEGGHVRDVHAQLVVAVGQRPGQAGQSVGELVGWLVSWSVSCMLLAAGAGWARCARPAHSYHWGEAWVGGWLQQLVGCHA